MECKHFGQCGSCKIYEDGYDAQLEDKVVVTKKLFEQFINLEGDIFRSPDSGFRFRSEFKIFHDSDGIHYAMYDKNKKLFNIEECKIVNDDIQNIFEPLLENIVSLDIGHKLFAVEFLSTTTKEMIITLIYHKILDENWEEKA